MRKISRIFKWKKEKMVRVLEVCMAQLLSGYHGQGVACEEK